MTDHRVEQDTMGAVHVPADALWGAQTQRAVQNFPISGRGLAAGQIRALGWIKAAAAQVNAEYGILDAELAQAIEAAAREVAQGEHDGQFPVDTFQTGSGTSSNMNANEVVAALASRRLGGAKVHPNDHVNASQSSNDVFPSAVHLAAVEALVHDLVPALAHLLSTLDAKANELDYVVKAGRTHLMDAAPVTLGQEMHGYAAQVRLGIERLQAALPRLGELPLGGTAVGTGLNAPVGFGTKVVAALRQLTGLPLSEATNHFEAQGARDALVEVSGQLRTVAVSLFKIANDIRLLGSGPRAGLAELRIPQLQPGSSIMPGKVNPVMSEAVRQVCAQVIGNDAAVAFAGTQGELELNAMIPVMGRNLLESISLLAAVSRLFADRCVAGLTADEQRCRIYAEDSVGNVASLTHYLGYEEAAAVARQAMAEGTSVRAVVLERGHVAAGRITQAQLDEALDVVRMTRAQP